MKKERYTLADLLDDPAVELLMKSDGADRRSVELLLERIARARRARLDRPESDAVLDGAPVPC